MRREDKLKVKNADKIISISKNVQERVKEIYGRETRIVYPFVDTEKFRYLKTGDYYLSGARLTPDKRVDVIAEAFKKMPDKKLVVVSGGTELAKIKKQAEGHSNIVIKGWVSEKELHKYYGECIATIAVSEFEDFGMVAIESMAAGKPVIASGDKGFSETVIDGKTGYLIDATEENIINSVKKLTPEKAKSMRKVCEKRALKFSKKEFIKNMKKVVKEAAG